MVSNQRPEAQVRPSSAVDKGVSSMGYIRSNEDYYQSLGYSNQEIKRRIAYDEAGIDHGVCNPIKSKIADEEEREIDKQLGIDD
jgi:transcriptional regulator of nitric oxide reductase